MSRRFLCIAAAALVALRPELALAHANEGALSGIYSGAMHPLSGLDHMLTMLAIGWIAMRIGGRARWIVPGSFVVVMLLGGIVGSMQLTLPVVEAGIAGSVVALGLVVAARPKLSAGVAVAASGIFALFHGHAHGSEMPAGSAVNAYSAGFALATVLLHLTGMGIAVAARSSDRAKLIRQLGGGGMAIAGIAMLGQAV